MKLLLLVYLFCIIAYCWSWANKTIVTSFTSHFRKCFLDNLFALMLTYLHYSTSTRSLVTWTTDHPHFNTSREITSWVKVSSFSDEMSSCCFDCPIHVRSAVGFPFPRFPPAGMSQKFFNYLLLRADSKTKAGLRGFEIPWQSPSRKSEIRSLDLY